MTEKVSDIRYLERHEIDAVKWDQCIAESSNGLIYAQSIYLDTMSKKWSALILNDYEAIMPLTWNRKYGFSYLYQPAFTAQLGIFYKGNPNPSIFNEFISQTKKRFRFCEIHLNYGNDFFFIPLRANYILKLGKAYSEIRAGYKKRLIENLREADPHHLRYLSSMDYARTISLFKSMYAKKIPHVHTSDYDRFETLCSELFKCKMIFVRQTTDPADNVLATCIFFRDQRRIYNIMSVSLPEGREKRAHFFLVDRLISEFSKENIYIDFEGSEIPGIAEFYRKFGSSNQPYPFLKFNLLPFPFRLFK
jgi:hypothetical protein